MNHTGLADLAEHTALAAAEAIRQAREQQIVIAETKSSDTDLVTETDRVVERLIIDRLLRDHPDASTLGEETGRRIGDGPLTFIIDPIDGTTNFVYDLPGFNISIAAAVDGEVVAGVVVDPIRSEVFRAIRGQGATRNGHPIRCRTTPELSYALVGTGFSYDPARRRAQGEVVAHVIAEVRDIRRMGAAALDLCSVAAGRLDAYFESGLKEWDLAAGMLIASEAGATVTGLDQAHPDGTFVIAASPEIAPALGDLLRALERSGLDVADPSAQPGWKAGRLEAWEPRSSPSKTTNASAPR